MTHRLLINHKTVYDYDAAVPYSLLQLRLTPRDRPGQQIEDWCLDIEGGKIQVQYKDHNDNHLTLVSLNPGTDQVVITCQGAVDVQDTQGVIGRHSGPAQLWLFKRQTRYTEAGRQCKALAERVHGDVGSVSWLHDLSAIVRSTITYEIGATNAYWRAEDAAKAGHGVCQDHAHIFIACCRLKGIAARYVSGYLLMDDRTHQNASHAWAEAHVDGLGWVGFDISNGISPDHRYVCLATGLDYGEAAPVSGLRYGQAQEKLAVHLSVQQ
jgi:transglutaminase-like putative cysteine protease